MPRRTVTLDGPDPGMAIEPDADDEVLATIAAERRRIARDLHDTSVQSLCTALMCLDAAGTRAARADQDATRAIAEARRLLRRGLEELYQAIWTLPFPELSSTGLGPSVRRLARAIAQESGMEIRADVAPLPRIPAPTEEVLFRVCREGLINAWRHAHAKRVRVRLAAARGVLRLEVDDDGIGVRGELREVAGFGLLNASKAVAAAGGTLELARGERGGSRLLAAVPLRDRKLSGHARRARQAPGGASTIPSPELPR